jgi:predicted tellurium resistance membrane protein TerC
MRLQLWEWLLFGGALYLAVMSLTRLIQRRRAEWVAELTQQAADEQARQREEESRQAALKAAQAKPTSGTKRRAA